MITKLGEDSFGRFLTETLEKEGVNTDLVFKTDEANTALAFVSLDENGEREFSFYRKPSADLFLSPEDIDRLDIAEGDILHFGSVDLVDFPVRAAHVEAISSAKASGAIVSFDPNLRYPLWKSAKELIDTVHRFIPYSDILKISEEELFDITGISEEEKAVRALFAGDVQLILVTKGAYGATAYTSQGFVVSVPAESVEKAADTTGAGDTFVGTFLYQLLRDGVQKENLGKLKETLGQYLVYANRAAGCVVQRSGAIPAMPTAKEVFED